MARLGGRLGAGLAALALAGSAGCSSAASIAGHHPPASTGSTPTRAGPPRSTEPAGPGTATPSSPGAGRAAAPVLGAVRSRTEAVTDVAWLTMTGRWVGFAANARHHPERLPRSIYDLDLATGRLSRLWTTEYPHGFVQWASAGDGWLVWTDQSVLQHAMTQPVQWAVWAADLATDRVVRVAVSRPAGSPVTPGPVVGDGRVVWDDYLGLRVRAADVWVYNLRTGARRLLMHRIAGGGQKAIVAHQLVYALSPSAYLRKPEDWVMARPLDGGLARKVSRDSAAIDLSAADGAVGWQEPITGDPKRLMADSLRPGSTPYRLVGPSLGHLELADGFATYLDRQDRYRLVAVEPDARSSLLPESARSVAVSGHRVAWFSIPQQGWRTHSSFSVATVTTR